MSVQNKSIPNPDTQAMLDCLREAVKKNLDRKRRLGQYVVQWSNNAPVLLGDDVPKALQQNHD
jgi:hypothetical protein